jgi:hypothetical protein
MEPEKTHHYSESLKTAPLPIAEGDRSFRAMMSSNVRQRSEDRQPTQPRDIHQSMEHRENGRKMERENGRSLLGKEQKENRLPNSFSSSFREGSGHGFLNNLKSSAMGKGAALSKGLFGKARSGSTHEMAPFVDDMTYQLKILNLPLVDQTRITRISKKLEDSRDKTEFWMPSLPWRAIDYLNYKGSEVEGLYRVPGSTQEIKKWQRRFDEGKNLLLQYISRANAQQNSISISLNRMTFTTLTSLVPCSRLGSVNSPTNCFQRQPKIALLQHIMAKKKCPKCSRTSSQCSRHSITTSYSLSPATSLFFYSTRQRTR